MTPMRFLAAVAGVLLVASQGGCKKRAPEVPPAQARTLPALQVDAKGKWLFTYADDSGRFVTTDDATSIPPASRRLVRVVDPSWAADARRDGVMIYVVDLEGLLSGGKVPARALSREAFETGALAQLTPGASSELPPPGAPAPVAPAAPSGTAGVAAEPPAAPATGPAVVTLYGTSWCGACKSARSYLQSRQIPFADKDIERDPAAARELQDKARQLGVRADRVPILDVRGRLLIGFDKDRLEALLGEAT